MAPPFAQSRPSSGPACSRPTGPLRALRPRTPRAATTSVRRPLRVAASPAAADTAVGAPQAADAAAVAADAKAKIRALAAARRGPDQRAAVEAEVARLAALNMPGGPPEAGSKWITIWTNSTGPSSGRLGPFRGPSRQAIDAGGAPCFRNSLQLPFLTATIDGAWTVRRPDRLDLTFAASEIRALGGLFTKRKEFSPPMRGHWRLVYGDAELRVIETNKLSLFVLARED